MTSNIIETLVDTVIENLGTEPDAWHRDSKFEAELRRLALSIKQEMEAEEARFGEYLDSLYDGMMVQRDAALERGVWA